LHLSATEVHVPFFKKNKNQLDTLRQTIKLRAILELNYLISFGSKKQGENFEKLDEIIDDFILAFFQLKTIEEVKRALGSYSEIKRNHIANHLAKSLCVNIVEDKTHYHFSGLSYSLQHESSIEINKQFRSI